MSLEIYTAQYPVNQWIVVGEPVVSKDDLAFRIQWGQIEVHGGNFKVVSLFLALTCNRT